jgi:aryl-alcohol dehydrogenase-like predicted oxidoreductase
MTERGTKVGRRELLLGGGALAVAAAVGSADVLGSRPTMSTAAATTDTVTAAGRRRLGALEVSSIGIGVQNMPRTFHTTVPSRPEMLNILRTAFDRGVTFYDTAEVYGPHESERILGEGVKSFRDEIVIATKFGFNVDLRTGVQRPGLNSRPAHIRRVVEGSLRRLRTDRIDLLYQHRVDPAGADRGRRRDRRGAARRGQGPALGAFGMGLQTLRRAHRELPVSAVQNEYSMLWRGPEQALLATCEELGIGLVPFSPLGYGFLTGAIDEVTSFAAGDFRSLTSRMDPENRRHNLALVALLRSWAVRKEARPAQIALAWLMAQRPWIVPIPGSTQMPHMLENIGSTTVTFSRSELTDLNRAISAIRVRGARLPAAVQAWSGVEAPTRR